MIDPERVGPVHRAGLSRPGWPDMPRPAAPSVVCGEEADGREVVWA